MIIEQLVMHQPLNKLKSSHKPKEVGTVIIPTLHSVTYK